jgi:hypothetical protein
MRSCGVLLLNKLNRSLGCSRFKYLKSFPNIGTIWGEVSLELHLVSVDCYVLWLRTSSLSSLKILPRIFLNLCLDLQEGLCDLVGRQQYSASVLRLVAA